MTKSEGMHEHIEEFAPTLGAVVDVGLDVGERVVDLVADTRGERSDGNDPLHLHQLRLELTPRGDVSPGRDDIESITLLGLREPGVGLDPCLLTVVVLDRDLDRDDITLEQYPGAIDERGKVEPLREQRGPWLPDDLITGLTGQACVGSVDIEDARDRGEGIIGKGFVGMFEEAVDHFKDDDDIFGLMKRELKQPPQIFLGDVLVHVILFICTGVRHVETPERFSP